MGLPKMNWDSMSNEEILELFKQQYNKIQPKDAIEFFEKSNNTPSAYILKTRLGLSYGEVLNKLCLRIGRRPRSRDMSKLFEKHSNKMKEVYNKLGHIPNTVEAYKNGINTSNIKKVFGITYAEFVEIVFEEKYNYYDTKINKTNQQLLQQYKNLCLRLCRVATSRDIELDEDMPSATSLIVRFGSMNKIKEASGVDELFSDRRKYTKNKVLKLLKELYVENEKRLTVNELNEMTKNNNLMPSVTTIHCCFKTTVLTEVWEEVEKELIKDYIKMLKNTNKLDSIT